MFDLKLYSILLRVVIANPYELNSLTAHKNNTHTIIIVAKWYLQMDVHSCVSKNTAFIQSCQISRRPHQRIKQVEITSVLCSKWNNYSAFLFIQLQMCSWLEQWDIQRYLGLIVPYVSAHTKCMKEDRWKCKQIPQVQLLQNGDRGLLQSKAIRRICRKNAQNGNFFLKGVEEEDKAKFAASRISAKYSSFLLQ